MFIYIGPLEFFIQEGGRRGDKAEKVVWFARVLQSDQREIGRVGSDVAMTIDLDARTFISAGMRYMYLGRIEPASISPAKPASKRTSKRASTKTTFFSSAIPRRG